VASARSAAFQILLRVEQDRHAHADELLYRAQAGFSDPRETALCEELVYGALRHQARLDFWIAGLTGKPEKKLDAEVRVALRLGLYQLRLLDRIPARAAVHESVELVKKARKHSAAALVNAVLRKADSAPEPADPAVALSMPAWLLDRWTARFGVEPARAIAQAALQKPEVYERGGRRMDIGSQSIAPLLDLKPGHRFLDLCAAPGNKTLHALETPGILAVACDISFQRLLAVPALVPRVCLDATVALPFGMRFHRILVDAPCSGTGTLGRNPEIKWRLTRDALVRHAERQRAILRNALEWLEPGGRLVYSTCSLEPEENEEVAGEFTRDWRYRIPGQDPGDGFFAAVIVP
jgi:16S rRNA (cytosine967-C5)-methyltransferase